MFGPLSTPLVVMGAGLFLLASSRLFLASWYQDRVGDVSWAQLFLVGVRFDVLILCYLLLLPSVLLLILPDQVVDRLKTLFAGYFGITIGIVLYMEMASLPFIEEYDLRPDRKFFEYLKHPKEVSGTLFKAYLPEIVISTFVFMIVMLLSWRLISRLLQHREPWGYPSKMTILPIVLGLMILGARSSLGHRPANISSAAFSSNHLANELALNSTYSLFYAAYRFLKHEKNPSSYYGHIDDSEMLERIKDQTSVTFTATDESPIPFLHTQSSPFAYDRPPNIVIFLQESMGASDVGCLSGPPITPNLCKLRERGTWFSNLYATGTRTVRGIEAVGSGFLPTANRGVVKLGLAKRNFFTIASLLKQHGYSTEFIYGGMSNFDEMRSFFLGNGYDRIYDEPTFANPVFKTTWGVSDEDLVRSADKIFKRHGDKPFLAFMLSTSNHVPYEFPEGRISLYEQPANTHYNAVKYADYAIGLLFELAEKSDYYKNTIFLIVADHNSHVRGNEHVPIDKFHIPALLIGPNVPIQQYDKLASQIDLLPTLLHYTGLTTKHPMVGRNLATLSNDVPGRAIMQFANNAAYQVGSKVVILRPHLTPLHFLRTPTSLTPADIDKELERDALAFSKLPWYLYSNRLYGLAVE